MTFMHLSIARSLRFALTGLTVVLAAVAADRPGRIRPQVRQFPEKPPERIGFSAKGPKNR
ncbi:MAG TPA: hypothetical protein VII87_07995 [Solirubrobacteraceae bacterium]